MRHPRPAELAEHRRGRLAAADAERIARHLDDCAACRERDGRVARAVAAMRELPDQVAPELGWDHIAARIHWVTSSERRRSQREQAVAVRSRARVVVAAVGLGGLVAAAGVALVVAGGGDQRLLAPPERATASLASARGVADAIAAVPAPGTLSGVVTFAQGEVRADGAAIDLARALGPGSVIETGAGRVTVQFGKDSGFTLGPASRVTLRAFDARTIELALTGAGAAGTSAGATAGTINVEVSHRAADQVFAVVAGTRRVVVRGTRFRVADGSARLDVSCTRGEVLVGDRSGEVAVAAGLAVTLEPGALIAAARLRPIDPTRLAALDRSLAMPLLPAWTDPGALFQTSSVLDVDAAIGVPVAIDGLAVGEGSFRMRVMSGRHQLQAGGDEGTWIDAAAGAPVAAVDLAARDRASAAAAVAGARRIRRAQLSERIEASRSARACLRSLEKQGLAEGAFVSFEIRVDERGAKRHVNVVASNLPPAIEGCLRAVIDDAELPPGPAATVNYRLEL